MRLEAVFPAGDYVWLGPNNSVRLSDMEFGDSSGTNGIKWMSFHPRYCTDKKRSVYGHKNGPELFEDVTMRGCMYSRQIDGVSFIGKSSCGGLWIELGNHEKVGRLNLLWRNLQQKMSLRPIEMGIASNVLAPSQQVGDLRMDAKSKVREPAPRSP